MEGSQDKLEAGGVGEWPGDGSTPVVRGGSHYLVLFGLIAGTASMGLLAVVADPDPRGHGTHEQLGLAPCRMIEWTGVPCPGCGVTTSVTLAVQGHPVKSFLVQPFGLVTAVSLPLLTLWALIGHVRGRDLYRTIDEQKGRWVKVGLVLMGLAWFYKIVAV